MTVIVAMPWYGAPELLERAAVSVLAQSHRDLRLVIVDDGNPAGSWPDRGSWYLDSRLVRILSDVNHGPYFWQEAILEAVPRGAWYAVVGADDWVEPEHLERLLEQMDERRVAVPGSVWWHEETRAPFVHAGRYEVGVFDPDRIRAIGGFNVDERVGQDTLTLKLLDLTGGMVVDLAEPPTYHRVRREGSLTTSPETGFRTRYRNDLRRRNRRVYADAIEMLEQFPQGLASMRRRRMSQDLRDMATRWAELIGRTLE